MNYLAHLFLSGTNEKLMVGNFIGDFVKGKQWEKYHPDIGRGILLHRQIDDFTDRHQKFTEAKKFFQPTFGLYSGIVIDFLYDHYLAKNWNDYADVNLSQFTKHAHTVLLKNFMKLPLPVQQFLPFLIKNKRLESYATIEGIIEATKIMSKYSSLPDKPDDMMKTWSLEYEKLEDNFSVFMPELIQFSKSAIINSQGKY